MSDENEEEKGFRVTDKRKANREEQAPKKEQVLGNEAGVHVGSVDGPKLPPIDFGNFVLSLAHSALVAMGLVEHPELGGAEVDLDAARQSIEIIEMLREKTRNNLDEEEDKLINSLLYELRMSFVDASAQKVD